MLNKDSVVALFDEHTQTGQVVKELRLAGIDMKTLSIVGRGYHTEEDVVGYYTARDELKCWGKNGVFWGGTCGLLFGSAFFIIPEIGALIAAGPVVAWIVAALEGATIVGGMSAIGAGLYSIGVSKRSILQCEASLKDGMFMLLVHGTLDEVTRAKTILAALGASKPQLRMAYAQAAARI